MYLLNNLTALSGLDLRSRKLIIFIIDPTNTLSLVLIYIPATVTNCSLTIHYSAFLSYITLIKLMYFNTFIYLYLIKFIDIMLFLEINQNLTTKQK